MIYIYLEVDIATRGRTLFSMVISQRSRTRPILFSPPITLSSSVKFSKPATGWRTPTHLSAHLSADVIDELESSLSAAIMGCVQSILMLTASRGAAGRAVKWGEWAPMSLLYLRRLLLHFMLLVAFFGPVCHIWWANLKSPFSKPVNSISINLLWKLMRKYFKHIRLKQVL